MQGLTSGDDVTRRVHILKYFDNNLILREKRRCTAKEEFFGKIDENQFAAGDALYPHRKKR